MLSPMMSSRRVSVRTAGPKVPSVANDSTVKLPGLITGQAMLTGSIMYHTTIVWIASLDSPAANECRSGRAEGGISSWVVSLSSTKTLKRVEPSIDDEIMADTELLLTTVKDAETPSHDQVTEPTSSLRIVRPCQIASVARIDDSSPALSHTVTTHAAMPRPTPSTSPICQRRRARATRPCSDGAASSSAPTPREPVAWVIHNRPDIQRECASE